MPPIAVVVDASVCLKWFHTEGEGGVEAARALVDAARAERIELLVLDLTAHEVGNALLRGHGVGAEEVGVVLGALHDICRTVAVTTVELTEGSRIAAEHGLTLYDATHAAVARARGAAFTTADRRLIRAGLGQSPEAVLAQLA